LAIWGPPVAAAGVERRVAKLRQPLGKKEPPYARQTRRVDRCGYRPFIDSAIPSETAILRPAAPIRVMSLRATHERENMKLIIGRPDETEVVLAEQVNGAWKPNPNIASEMVSFLQGADPEQFEMWVEEPE
jgi:hypothetical protein